MPVRTKDQLKAELNTTFFENPGGGITPALVRTFMTDVVDSVPDVITAKSFGAKGDGVTDDTAAINVAFRYIESIDEPIPFVFGPYSFKIAGSVVLPTTSGNRIQEIIGDGCELVLAGSGVKLGRIPASQDDAMSVIDQCIYHVSGIHFTGDLTTGQVGLHIGANYTTVVENCQFEALDIGSIGSFVLGGIWRGLRYEGCKSFPFILQSGQGVWSGGAVDFSNSNCNLVENCRVHGIPGQTASFAIYASDGVVLHNIISEGSANLYDILFDYQFASTVNKFTIDGLHCENPNVKVNLKIKAKSLVNISNLVRSYPAAILDASGSSSVSWNFKGLSYLGNMPTNAPTDAANPNGRWFYHSDGGGYGGVEAGASNGNLYRFSDSINALSDSGGIATAAHWENGVLPTVLVIEDTQGGDLGYKLYSNSPLTFKTVSAYGLLVQTNLNFNADDTYNLGGLDASTRFAPRTVFVGTGGINFKNTSQLVGTGGTSLKALLANGTTAAPLQGKLTTDANFTAGAPSATGYLTLYDASGNGYKVLAAPVLDVISGTGTAAGSGTATAVAAGGPVFQVDFTTAGVLPAWISVTSGSPVLSSSGLLISTGDVVMLSGGALTALTASAASVIVEIDGAHAAYAQIVAVDAPFSHAFIARDNVSNNVYFYDDFSVLERAANNLTDGSVSRIGIAFDSAPSQSSCANGGTVATATNGFITVSAIRLGGRSDGSFAIGANIRSLAIYNTRLSNSDLQTKSVVGASY